MAAARAGTRIFFSSICLALGCVILAPQKLAAQVVIQPGDQIVAVPAGTSRIQRGAPFDELPGLRAHCAPRPCPGSLPLEALCA